MSFFFFFFFLSYGHDFRSDQRQADVCLLAALRMAHRQAVHCGGFAWGRLLWAPPFTRGRRGSERHWKGGCFPRSHRTCSWDGLALCPGCENGFLTSWKHGRRQMIWKRLADAVAIENWCEIGHAVRPCGCEGLWWCREEERGRVGGCAGLSCGG